MHGTNIKIFKKNALMTTERENRNQKAEKEKQQCQHIGK
jgi:hypothetical protein